MMTQETGIHQKRTLAFINHFIMRTIEFMNNFAVQCETKLMEFENKLQKTEASLVILETKLLSIPEIGEFDKQEPLDKKHEQPACEPEPPDIQPDNENIESTTEDKIEKDPRYEKFFKMIQFGVPIEAVKLKIKTEGLDPNVIN